MNKSMLKIIFAILILALAATACNLPFSARANHATAATSIPISATTPIPITATAAQVWTSYVDKEWKFSLEVPSLVGGKQFVFIQDYSKFPGGLDQVLLLSDSSNAKTQIIGENESTRVTIFRWKADNATTFDLWAVRISAHAGKGKLTYSMNGSCPELKIKAEKPVSPYRWASANWVNGGDTYYGILFQGMGNYPSEGERVIESFQPEECK
jgi:hypothetical protein